MDRASHFGQLFDVVFFLQEREVGLKKKTRDNLSALLSMREMTLLFWSAIGSDVCCCKVISLFAIVNQRARNNMCSMHTLPTLLFSLESRE